MTIKEAYRVQMMTCGEKGIRYEGSHYKTRIEFNGKRVYVSPDGSDIVRYEFPITGCLKRRVVQLKSGKYKTVHYHKDRLPVYGTITRRKGLKGFLYKYLLFLRCDGIEDRDLMRLYLLHCMTFKFEYWRKKETHKVIDGKEVTEYKDWEMYEPEYEDVVKMIDGLIEAAARKELDDRTREQFAVRTHSVVNPEAVGHRDKTGRETLRDGRIGMGLATDNRIGLQYDPDQTDKENANRIGVSLRRFQEWKKDHVESPKDRIRRLYDTKKSVKENAELCNVSERSIQRYRKTLPKTEKKEETEESWIEKMLDDLDGENSKTATETRHKVDEEDYDLLDWIREIEP